MLGLAELDAARHNQGRDRAQPRDNFTCLVEPLQMGITGGEKPIWLRKVRPVLDREEELWDRLVEAPAYEQRTANHAENRANSATRAEPQSGLGMLDRNVGLPRLPP